MLRTRAQVYIDTLSTLRPYGLDCLSIAPAEIAAALCKAGGHPRYTGSRLLSSMHSAESCTEALVKKIMTSIALFHPMRLPMSLSIKLNGLLGRLFKRS